MKGDLDRLLQGKEIYRHEDLKSVSDKWDTLTTCLQFGSIGLLFASMFIFDALPKATVRGIIWYWAGGMFILATVTFFLSRIALQHKMEYLNAEGKRVGEFLDEAIEKVKGDEA